MLSVIVVMVSRSGANEVGQGPGFRGPTGLQLYSLRDMFKQQGVTRGLDQVRRWGFKYVEVADTFDLTPAEFKAELDQRGLIPIGKHFPYQQLRDDIDGVIRDAQSAQAPLCRLRLDRPSERLSMRHNAARPQRSSTALARPWRNMA